MGLGDARRHSPLLRGPRLTGGRFRRIVSLLAGGDDDVAYPDNPPLLHYAFALSVDGCPIPVVNPSSRRAPEDYIRELPLGEVRPSR